MRSPRLVSFAKGMATALLLCRAAPVLAQGDENAGAPSRTPEALAQDALRALQSAYSMRHEASFAEASRVAESLVRKNRERVRAPEIDAVLRAEQQRLALTGIRMALTGVTSARELLPGMELRDGESALALCRDSPRVLPVEVRSFRMEGAGGVGREVSVACDAEAVIVGLPPAPVRAAEIQGALDSGIGRGVALLDERVLHVRASGGSTEGVRVSEQKARSPEWERAHPGNAGTDEVRVDVPGLKSNGAYLQLVWAGDLNGDGRLDAVLRFAATLEDSDSISMEAAEGFVWRLVLSKGPDAPPAVAAWTLESDW
ncbi:hypothetical protein [Archangium sp.]|uniref:hypothetical protein n=1 Tax=Archangium sp. TaxID=1872627 RepID=UPI003899B75C